MKRKLHNPDGTVIGEVTVRNGVLTTAGAAVPLFKRLRKTVGDKKLGAALMKQGWSNGYSYLGELEE